MPGFEKAVCQDVERELVARIWPITVFARRNGRIMMKAVVGLLLAK